MSKDERINTLRDKMKTKMASIDVQTINFIPDVKAPLDTFSPAWGESTPARGESAQNALFPWGFNLPPLGGNPPPLGGNPPPLGGIHPQ